MKKKSGLKENTVLQKELILFSKCVFSLVPNLFFYRQKFIWGIHKTIFNRIPDNYVILFIYIIYKYKYFQISGFIELLLLEEYWIRQSNYQVYKNMSSVLASYGLHFYELSVEWLHAKPNIYILLISQEPDENRKA